MSTKAWVEADNGLNSGAFIIDKDTREELVLHRSSAYDFRFGFFSFGLVRVMDGLASLRLLIRPSQTDYDAVVLDKSVASGFTAEISPSSWRNENAYHALLSVTSPEMDIDLGGEQELRMWMVLEATYDDASIEVLGAAHFLLVESNTDSSGTTYMLKSIYDSDNDNQVDTAASADTVAWSGVTGKPVAFAGAGADGLVPDPVTETGSFLKDDGTWAAPAGLFSPTTFTGTGTTGYVPNPGSETGKYLEDDGSWSAPASTPFTGAGTSGYVPDPVTATGEFLKDDGTWAVPTDTTYSVFTGIGTTGLVPDPAAEADKFLKDDGTWDYPQTPQTTAVFAGMGADGLVPDPVAESGLFLRDDGTWAAETTFSGAGAVGLVPDPVSTGGLFLKDNGGWAKEVSFTGAGTSGLVPDPTTATGQVLSDAGTWVTRPAYEHIVFDLVGPGTAIANTTYWVTNWPTNFIPHEIILNTQVHYEDFTADLKVNSVSFLTAGPKTISGNMTIVAQTEINVASFPSYQLLRGRTIELVLAGVSDYGTADDGLQIIFKGTVV